MRRAERAPQQFDLNIERVLEHWTVAHAVREVIANALDEQALTGTREPEIIKAPDGTRHICDHGRGIRYEHLTQKENGEKLRRSDEVIGKFGVGLKDALATFDRHRSTRLASGAGHRLRGYSMLGAKVADGPEPPILLIKRACTCRLARLGLR